MKTIKKVQARNTLYYSESSADEKFANLRSFDVDFGLKHPKAWNVTSGLAKAKNVVPVTNDKFTKPVHVYRIYLGSHTCTEMPLEYLGKFTHVKKVRRGNVEAFSEFELR